ncbi:sensor histidine kinase [Bradyrhizobium canariense]|uniref:sensor histidine kinase n=1 Tax=Bradyrhizobium canariense TaxID=255045 RepID=UPI003D9B909F
MLVNFDQPQLQQVIINLILNAMDAMSSVPASNRKITISTTRVENSADIIVSDTGAGISADIVQLVFEPFFSTKPEGMGMGGPSPHYSGSQWRSDLDRGQGREWRGFSHPPTALRNVAVLGTDPIAHYS